MPIKTIKEYLQEIPSQEHREKALANLDSEKTNDLSRSVEHALYAGFSWYRSPEGIQYWNDYHKQLQNIILNT